MNWASRVASTSDWDRGRYYYEIYRAHEAEGNRFVKARYLPAWDRLGYESRVAWMQYAKRLHPLARIATAAR